LRLDSFFNRCWYGTGWPSWAVAWGLSPFSLVFRILIFLRRLLYRQGLKHITRLPVPVIVVGNLTVGGTGKTPFTLALITWLREAGYSPGIISRGYGGRVDEIRPVHAQSDPLQVGDEPVLLARRGGCPVWVGRARTHVGAGLLAAHPEVDVLVADDGLQHYALARDLEIVLVDGARGFGNGWLLPSGPLREPLARLQGVSAVVVNEAGGGGALPDVLAPVFAMTLRGERFYDVWNPARVVTASALHDQALCALAGIGNPSRFFAHLRRLGLNFSECPLPDHHVFSEQDLPVGTLVMTEKDAVKCASLAARQIAQDCWYLAVDAELGAGLKELVLSSLRRISSH